jgi:hypothetical protein
LQQDPLRRTFVDIRIGVTQAAREISLELADSERDDTRTKIDAALSGAVDVLWLVDKKGRSVAVPSAKIAYVEIGSIESDRRIGFGG